MNISMNARDHVTVAVFEDDDRAKAEEVARELAARNHLVYIHEGDEFTSNKLPLRATALRRGVVRGALLVGVVAVAVVATLQLMSWLPAGAGLNFWRVLGVLAIAMTFGGLAGAFSGAMSASPELDKAARALTQPGRFALTVAYAPARRPFIEARLAQTGAVAVGSM